MCDFKKDYKFWPILYKALHEGAKKVTEIKVYFGFSVEESCSLAFASPDSRYATNIFRHLAFDKEWHLHTFTVWE